MPFEIGQRVVFRSLHWEVADTSSDSTLELFGRSRENQGRTVRVVPGFEPIERAEVPELPWTIGSDFPHWDHTAWKALHDAYRLTLVHGRGHLGAVDWGRLILEPYQLVPLRRIEQLPFPRLMLADDTGLGKTAEAGLILFRLLQRRRAERVLILTRARPEPERWQAELREKFGLSFRVINAGQDYARLRREVPAHLNVFSAVPRLIMSMHFAAQPHIVDDLRREVRWDVVIVDEAHHLAERGSGQKRLTELGRVLADRCEALLLLTATPHDGKGESFASLLQLLDPYSVADPSRLDLQMVQPLIVRRLKTQVVRADGNRFLPRQIHMLDVEPYRKRPERSLDRGVRSYAKLLRKRAKQLEAAGERSKAMGATFLETFLRKRLASSAYACAISLRNRLARVRGEKLPAADAEGTAEEVPDDQAQTDLLIDPLTLPDGRTEEAVLLDLIAKAEKIPPLGQEAKVRALLDLLTHQLADQKVIIFTEFLDTLKMLEQVLNAEGYAGQFLSYHGATTPAEREERRRAFVEDPTIRFFLGTDAASEGINLQKTCHALVHMEIPWNPNRYEQRNGRIDRYGQTAPPQVYLLVATKSLEDRVAQVVLHKLEQIATQVGSVSNVFPLANRISIDAFLQASDADSSDDEDEEATDYVVDHAAEQVRQQLEQEEQTLQHELDAQIPNTLVQGTPFDVAEMEAITHDLEASRGFVPEYQDVQDFLRYFLVQLERGRIEPTDEAGIYRIVVPHSLQAEVGRERYSRATFRRDIAVAEADRAAQDGERVEFLSPGHPLVQAALRRMRGKIFAPNFQSRVSYRRVTEAATKGFFFTYAARYLDGRGETIEEQFMAVFVGLDGQVSQDAQADLHRFVQPEHLASDPNLNEQEEQAVLSPYREAFGAARASALQEAQRRQQERVQYLIAQQERIAEEALMRLGLWKHASEQRLRQRFDAQQVQQYDLFGVTSRRLQQFRKEQELLLKQEHQRREEIRAMKHVRGEGIDTIGGLVVI